MTLNSLLELEALIPVFLPWWEKVKINAWSYPWVLLLFWLAIIFYYLVCSVTSCNTIHITFPLYIVMLGKIQPAVNAADGCVSKLNCRQVCWVHLVSQVVTHYYFPLSPHGFLLYWYMNQIHLFYPRMCIHAVIVFGKDGLVSSLSTPRSALVCF